MYDLHKIIIMGKYDLEDRDYIETVAMVTDGMRIDSILYLNTIGSMPEKDKIREEIKSELYADMYDEDNLSIKVKECINGMDCMNKLAKFISKKYNHDTLLYFYEPDDGCYEYLKKSLLDINKDIYIDEYSSIFLDKNTDNDIYTIMKINNMKTENLIKDNKISMVYFLSGLIEKLYSK